MGKKCLKCGYERMATDNAADYECPKCGAIYAKVEAAIKKKSNSSHLSDLETIKVIKESVVQKKQEEGKHELKESKHVIKFRESHLKASEKILAWGEGYIGEMMGSGDKTQHNGVLVVTDNRVVFYRKGFLGEVLETIPLKTITSIERKSMMGHRIIRMHTSHDALEFKTFEKNNEQVLIDSIEEGREKTTSVREHQVAAGSDPMDTLKKLGELNCLGVITDKEFQEKKNMLLAKL
jgi:predicted RNA-binding Zn-ribbon protein involved in translation (DUF1610 family)